MLIYRCAHCGRELVEVDLTEPEPACPDHPNGVVEFIAVKDHADS